MSLVQSKKKIKELVPLGKVVDEIEGQKKKDVTYIYYDPNVPKIDRVKQMTLHKPIETIPYLDINSHGRSATFISGISGCGKSTLAAKFVSEIKTRRNDKKRKVVVFTTSDLDNIDPAFEAIKDIAIMSFDNPGFFDIDITDLSNYIVIFDDWECIKDKDVQSYTMSFVKDVLERGRKLKIDCILINHMSQNFNKTKNIIFEADTYMLNIQANKNSSKKFLNSYMEFSKDELKRIVEYESESLFSWSAFHKSLPAYYIQDDFIQLL